jgi:hypothetical protein
MGLKFLPFEKANVTAGCLETQFLPHDLCEGHHEQLVVTCIQALWCTENNKLPQIKKGLWESRQFT